LKIAYISRNASEDLLKMAWVYLIRNGDLYKIGRTDNLERRMHELRPDQQVEALQTNRSHEVEKELHNRFGAKRIPQTEYFRLSQNDVAAVQALLGGASSVTDAARRCVDESERKWNEEQAKKMSIPPIDQAETDRRYQEYLRRIRGNQP